MVGREGARPDPDRPRAGTFRRTLTALGAVLLLGAAAPIAPPAPVADAAMRGDLGTVRALLREGADVNEAQGDGMTALHWAARRGDVELTEILLYSGARADAGTRIGRYTPLHIAAGEASAEVVELLLDAGADVGAITTNSGATPLHLAARSGHPDIVEALLDHGAEVDAREGSWGQTPLTFAAAMNRVRAIELLLKAGADPNATAQSRDVVEMAAADQAAEERLGEALARFKAQEGGGPDWQPTPAQVQAAIDLARRVQQRWPDVPQDDEEDSEGDGASSQEAAPAAVDSAAVTADSLAAGQAEASGATEGATAPDTSEAATGASEGSAAPEGATTDSAQAAPADSTEAEEGTQLAEPVSYAEQIGQWGGLTPLHHAVRQGHVEATRALLKGGAEIDRRTGDGTTPLLMAAINGQWDLATVLLEQGADPNLASDAGATPLYAVLERQWQPRASYAHPDAYQRQETTHLGLMERLLEAGADPNARLTKHLWYMEYTFGVLRGSGIHLEGATPFWRASYALDVDAMRLLVAHGADPHIWTKKAPERRRRGQPMEEADSAEVAADSAQVADSAQAVVAEGDSAAAIPADGDSTSAASKAAQPGGLVLTESATGEGSVVDNDAAAADSTATDEAASTEGAEKPESEGYGEDEEDEEEDKSGIPPVPAGGPAIHALHAAAGVGYGQSFAGNAHRYVPNGWMAAVKFLIEEMGADVNARDARGYTALHHAASRGDVEMILYLVEKGADVTVVSRKGETTADMANGPVQRVQPYPEAIALLESLGSENNHNCVSC